MLGEAVRKQREGRNYTQEGFADSLAMHRAYYAAIALGKKNLQLTTLERVCAGLDVPIWEVLRENGKRLTLAA